MALFRGIAVVEDEEDVATATSRSCPDSSFERSADRSEKRRDALTEVSEPGSFERFETSLRRILAAGKVGRRKN